MAFKLFILNDGPNKWNNYQQNNNQQQNLIKEKEEKQSKIRQGRFRAIAGRKAGRSSLLYNNSTLGNQTQLGT